MADEKVDSSSAKPTKPPSLLDLCTKNAVRLFLSTDYLDMEWTSLEPHLQDLLFRGLRTEMARLQNIEDDWSSLEELCPLIDRKIYWEDHKIKDPLLEGVDGLEWLKKTTGTFKKKWSYIKEDDGGVQTTQAPEVRWSAMRLCWDGPEDYMPLWHQISLQLLLYRLTILFGMPPPGETDGYKMCWEAKLKYSDGVSILTFSDMKGAAYMAFYGSSEASTEALQLVEYLVSINCYHTYDGIRAGTMA